MSASPSAARSSHRWRHRAIVGALAAVAAVAAYSIVNAGKSTHHAAAVAPNTLFLQPYGIGENCTRDDPCGTLDAALKAADPGDVVQAAAGRYPQDQVLTPDLRKANAAPVIVRPAPGAKVTFGQVKCGRWSGDFGPGNFALEGITIGGILVHRCDRVTLRHVDVRGGVFVEGSTNFTMLGGSVGPGLDYHPDVTAVYKSNPPVVPHNVVFDGVRFHDWVRRDPSVHMECLQISDVVGLVVRNSTFDRCDVFDLHVDGTVAGPVRDVLIEHNRFAPTVDHLGGKVGPSYFSLSVRDGIGVRVLGNTSTQSFALPERSEDSGAVRGWTVQGNAAPLQPSQCDSRIHFRDNRWTAATCGPGDRKGPLPAAQP